MLRGGILFLSAASLLAAAPSYKLVKEWQVDVPGAAARTAVCPDGMLYLAGREGDLRTLDGAGKLVSDDRSAVFDRVSAAACTADRLYVSGSAGLFVFTRGVAGALTPLHVVKPGVPMAALAVASPDLIFVEGGGALHAVNAQGKVLYSFGLPRNPSVIRPGGAAGFLLWDKAGQRLLRIPGNRYEIQVYSRDGRLERVEVPGPQSFFQLIGGGRRPFLGRAEGIAPMADGRIVVQVRNVGHYNGWPAIFLQVFDGRLAPLAPDVETGPGFLAGASAAGDLYFLNASTVTKLRLATF